MTATPETLAVIPARAGSKGVPGKNLAPLGGKPLIAYSIEAALRCPGITRVVVITEDEEIAAVSRGLGAEIPFLRPRELAQDHSNLDDTFRYVMDRLAAQGYRPRHVAHLFPTSPFRPDWLMDLLVAKLHQGHQRVHTVVEVRGGGPYYALDAGQTARGLGSGDGQARYRSYGIFAGHCTFRAPFGDFDYVLKDPALRVDIDTPEDLLRAQAALKHRLVP